MLLKHEPPKCHNSHISPFCRSLYSWTKFTAKQDTPFSFFEHNPTPACVDNTSDDDKVELVQVASTATALLHVQDQQEFYKMMVKTMQIMQDALLQNQKIIVKFCDHEETVAAAKLQNSMGWLMYVTTDNVDWEDGTIKSVSLTTFTQEYKNLLKRSSAVQATQLTNLFRTIFSTGPTTNKEDDGGPLNRLMLLYIFAPKFTKGHLIAMFQRNDLELGAIYKSTSINPFHYAPQTNQDFIANTKKEIKEERNKKSFLIIKANCKKISSLTKGIVKINTMDDVTTTCANICGIQLAIINIAVQKLLQYQFSWKMICFI
jgi:hypothetical protein